MGDRKVSNIKSDRQGHSRLLALVPFDRQHVVCCMSTVVTMTPPCSVSEILSVISQNLKRSREP